MILLGSPLKAVVLRDARRDYSVGIPVLICAILHLYTMQFVALNAVQEQRKVASMSVPDLVEIDASQNAESVLFNIPLPCGHIARQLRCHEAQKPDEVRCQIQIEQVMEHCKHEIQVRCHELPLDVEYPCSATCGAALTCGHNCSHTCKRLQYQN